ncbi:hypothetical protein VTH06DRAFT_2253 [Thermothelomyces fergusii]
MSPTYTMSAHLCKQIYSSWRQARQGSSDDASRLDGSAASAYFPRPSSPPAAAAAAEKCAVGGERCLPSHPPSPPLSSSASSAASGSGSGSGSGWRGWGAR